MFVFMAEKILSVPKSDSIIACLNLWDNVDIALDRAQIAVK